MTGLVAVRSLRQAARAIKQMGYQAEGWESVREASRGAMKAIFEERMRAVRSAYLEEMATRGLTDRCNGYYQRRVTSLMGELELEVARTRTASMQVCVEAYARRDPELDRMILGCFVYGLSTRKVGRALLPVLGERVSPATVSRVAKGLDEAVAAFHRRPLRDRSRALRHPRPKRRARRSALLGQLSIRLGDGAQRQCRQFQRDAAVDLR